MNSVCVFGGSGFLGSQVCDILSKKGYRVIIFDNKKSNWLKAKQEMVVADILDYKKVDQVISKSDFVYNFAALSDLNESINEPIATANINIIGTLNILEACVKYNIKKFIYASSIYVLSHLGSFYRCSKQSAELFLEEYHRLHGLNFNILRYGSLYGPRSDRSNGVYRLIKQAIKNRKIIFSDHQETIREYIHTLDAAKASVEILESDKVPNRALMLTGNEITKSKDLANKIANILDINFEVKFDPKKNIYQSSHYIKEPNTYVPLKSEKYTIDNYVKLEQGISELIKIIKSE